MPQWEIRDRRGRLLYRADSPVRRRRRGAQ